MPLPAPAIESMLREAFPDAAITLTDLAGDDNHYSVTVISERFRGKTRVHQHKMVYDALKGHMGEALHALALKTMIPSAEAGKAAT